jgi:hypothetical protein
MRKIVRTRTILAVVAAVAVSACEMDKSSNPLSATVAGPIPGVTISAPRVMQPSSGTKIAADQQPITLMVGNAATSGVRPLSYVFEIAADTNFTNKVFTRDSISPGTNGQTTVRLPDSLATGRTYFWRSRAQDGANTGPYSTTTDFNVFTPIVINAPTPVSPINDATVSTVRPRFTFTNATRSGPVGAITYVMELSDTGTFVSNVVTWTVAEQAGSSTSLDPTTDLPNSKLLYWHVKAADPTTAGPWSSTASFKTPAPAAVVAPAPGPGFSGPAPNDGISLGSAIILNSPRDLASWPVTTSISLLDINASGFHFEFSKRDGPGRWPDVMPPGWSGSLQYTIGMALNINGQWYASAPVEFWYGLDRSGGPPSQVALNWFYDPGRWAPMTFHQPSVGEMVGFFLCAGDCRNNADGSLSPARERSNVVVVPYPSDAGATFRF